MPLTSFPSALDAIPAVADGQRQNVPPHSYLHNLVSEALAALEEKVGTDGSAVVTTLDFLLKSALSIDPGHKHSAGSITGLPSYADKETPAGSIDGSNAAFTLAHAPSSGSLHLFVNGMLQNEGSGNDYTLSGQTVTLAIPPDAGSVLLASYRY